MTKFLKRWLLNSAMGTAVILAFGVIIGPVVYFASLGSDWCIAISLLWIIIALAGLIAWIEKQ